jgi:glucose/arabinose dehydrogenase
MTATLRFATPTFTALLLLLIAIPAIAGACGGDDNPFAVESELVITADRAGDLAFAPDGRLFYAEQYAGNIRLLDADGAPLTEPFAHVDVAQWLDLDWGITGLALDPDFATNHYLYAFLTEPVVDDPQAPIGRPVILRYTDQDGVGVDPIVILDELPETLPDKQGFNANGSLHFGPDGYLYASLGDYDSPDPPLSQDLSTPVGSLLRIDKEDGGAAPGNPFADQSDIDPRIFAYGFRESFDFSFHPRTGDIFATDNTPSTCEELNLIQPGANYGWPDVGEFPFADCLAGDQTPAIHFFAKDEMQPGDFESAVFVSALDFVSADVYPLLGDSLLACESVTGLLIRLVLTDAQQVSTDDVVTNDCKRDIAVSPDGIIYYSNDTEIRRLTPSG